MVSYTDIAKSGTIAEFSFKQKWQIILENVLGYSVYVFVYLLCF